MAGILNDVAQLGDELATSLSLEAAKVIDRPTEAFRAAFAEAKVVALDAEGVDLSRKGEISIVQIATPKQCFLVDVLGKSKTDPLVVALRKVLEDADVVKIIHDCRMDADAMYHHLGIALTNVHDTSCWHNKLSVYGANKSLNDTLRAYGIPPNVQRDCSIYRRNPRFWAERPLTSTMIEWASGDVESLFTLYDRQRAQAKERKATSAELGIDGLTADFLSWKSATVSFITVGNPGRFIGRGGCNIHSTERRTNTIIYKAPHSVANGRRNVFMVYHRDSAALEAVERAA